MKGLIYEPCSNVYFRGDEDTLKKGKDYIVNEVLSYRTVVYVNDWLEALDIPTRPGTLDKIGWEGKDFIECEFILTPMPEYPDEEESDIRGHALSYSLYPDYIGKL